MELKDLYQDIIVDHNRNPRNFRKIADADRIAQGFNPLCGDKLTVYLKIDNGRITDISFEGSGCAISVASASLMTERLLGKPEEHADALFGEMHTLLTSENAEQVNTVALGKLAALEGVREYPSRVKCATLCWHTLKAALTQNNAAVSTE